MRKAVSTKARSTNSSVRSLLRGTGRAVIWTALGLLLIRGVLTEDSANTPGRRAARGVDPESAAFTVRFARTYLASPTESALAPFLAEGVRVGTGSPPDSTAEVAQAEVSESRDLGDGRSIVTVACELRDARTLYLAVPIVRSEAGEVAALGAPSIVAAPGAAGVASDERPQPVAGSESGAVQSLVSKFLPDYVAGSEIDTLSYFLAPGASVNPLGSAVELVGITGVTQLGPGEGPTREVLAGARLGDPASGATYPVVYRLRLVRGAGRWYVRSVEGASS